MQSGASHEKIPLDFFALVFLISVPFWLFGGSRLPLPVTLPVSALMVFNPLIAASTLSYRRNGLSGVKELVKKAIDYKKIKKIWYLPTLLLIPLIYALAYIVMRLVGLPLPAVPEIPLLAAPLFFILYFITATGEELGWMGYAIQPMQNRWGALKASIFLGLVWSIWHAIPDVQAQHSADWILWHRIYSVALRILIVWIFNNTGKSVFAAILVHTMDNVSWTLFPNYSSHYDPFINAMLTWLVAFLVIWRWGPETLAHFRRRGESR